jgi:hypothetical protein
MLKKALLHPPFPKRAKTRSFPSFVLGSKILNVPMGKSRSWPAQGWVGEMSVCFRFFLRLRPRWRTFLSILFHLEMKIEPVLVT